MMTQQKPSTIMIFVLLTLLASGCMPLKRSEPTVDWRPLASALSEPNATKRLALLRKVRDDQLLAGEELRLDLQQAITYAALEQVPRALGDRNDFYIEVQRLDKLAAELEDQNDERRILRHLGYRAGVLDATPLNLSEQHNVDALCSQRQPRTDGGRLERTADDLNAALARACWAWLQGDTRIALRELALATQRQLEIFPEKGQLIPILTARPGERLAFRLFEHRLAEAEPFNGVNLDGGRVRLHQLMPTP